MFFRADFAMPGHQGIKVQLLNLLQRLDPVIGIGVGKRTVGDRLDGNKIHGEKQSILRQQHDEAVIRVVFAGINQLHLFAAQFDGHPVREGQVRHRNIGIRRLQNFWPRGLLTHEVSRLGKNAAAADVIIMMVAVNDIPHRLIREGGDFYFQPGGGIGADGIGDDHTSRRDDEDGLMRLMPEEVHILGQIRNFVDWTGLLGVGRADKKKQHSQRTGNGPPFREDHQSLPLRFRRLIISNQVYPCDRFPWSSVVKNGDRHVLV
ncbi:MAG: hypothetical protein LZF60_270162 [Nitrospira sp.]|nr:MAG: hypothetical protein LZF60_270162 [Nitrospira sp.]